MASFTNLGRINKSLNKDLEASINNFNASYVSTAPINEPPTRYNYQTYPYDYFCGSCAKVFFGDIWVDDIVTIQWTVKQDKEPIYGYASQTYDAIARGIVIVQGAFTIAFKEMGYLNIIMNVLEGQRRRASVNADKSIVKHTFERILDSIASGNIEFNPALERIESPAGMVFLPTGQPEIIRQQQTIEDILKYKKYGNLVSRGLSADLNLDQRDRDFEDFAELMEDTIWGDSNGKPYTDVKVNLRRADEFDYTWENGRDTGGIVTGKTLFGTDYSQTLNILITFGDIDDYRAEHTMIVLNDVHIINTSMIIAPTGEPIGETYFFIARDINKALSNQVIKSLNPIKFNVGDGITFESMREKDIKSIEEFINTNKQSILTLEILSRFDYKWEAYKDDKKRYSESVLFGPNLVSWKSTMDQLLQLIENIINNPAGVFITQDQNRVKYKQYVLKATIMDEKDTTKSFNVIIDQQIPGTLTYRVISPTRSNFSAYSTFTRETLWEEIKKQEPPTEPDQAPIKVDDKGNLKKAQTDLNTRITDTSNETVETNNQKLQQVSPSISDNEQQALPNITDNQQQPTTTNNNQKQQQQQQQQQRLQQQVPSSTANKPQPGEEQIRTIVKQIISDHITSKINQDKIMAKTEEALSEIPNITEPVINEVINGVYEEADKAIQSSVKSLFSPPFIFTERVKSSEVTSQQLQNLKTMMAQSDAKKRTEYMIAGEEFDKYLIQTYGKKDKSKQTNSKGTIIITQQSLDHLERQDNVQTIATDVVLYSKSGKRIDEIPAPREGIIGTTHSGYPLYVSDPFETEIKGKTKKVQYVVGFIHTEPSKKVYQPTTWTIADTTKTNKVTRGSTIGTQFSDIGVTGPYKGKRLAYHTHLAGYGLVIDGKTYNDPQSQSAALRYLLKDYEHYGYDIMLR